MVAGFASRFVYAIETSFLIESYALLDIHSYYTIPICVFNCTKYGRSVGASALDKSRDVTSSVYLVGNGSTALKSLSVLGAYAF